MRDSDDEADLEMADSSKSKRRKDRDSKKKPHVSNILYIHSNLEFGFYFCEK
jgi:hypothetical protein